MTYQNQDPIDEVFEQWYDQFGVRYYTKEGHKAYLKYAFTNGLLHGANAANVLHNRFSQRKRSKGRSIYRYP